MGARLRDEERRYASGKIILNRHGGQIFNRRCRIRDLDMTKKMMNFTKLNILAQSGQANLSQENQLPQNVMRLLR